MEGKKIKIVGKKSDPAKTPPVVVSVNHKAKRINVSDSESEDEIPARAKVEVVKKGVGRPPGRPSLKPTRGGGTAGRGTGRGRGRPRKSG